MAPMYRKLKPYFHAQRERRLVSKAYTLLGVYMSGGKS
jgi:hypothetical protein